MALSLKKSEISQVAVDEAATEAAKDVKPKASVIAINTGIVEYRDLAATLERQARSYETKGEYASASALYTVAASAGHLRQALAATHGKFTGDTADMLAALIEIV